MSGWEPIESAPKDGTHILAYGWQYNVGMDEEGRYVQREIWCKWKEDYHFEEAEVPGLYKRVPHRYDEHWAPDKLFTPIKWRRLSDPFGPE